MNDKVEKRKFDKQENEKENSKVVSHRFIKVENTKNINI